MATKDFNEPIDWDNIQLENKYREIKREIEKKIQLEKSSWIPPLPKHYGRTLEEIEELKHQYRDVHQRIREREVDVKALF